MRSACNLLRPSSTPCRTRVTYVTTASDITYGRTRVVLPRLGFRGMLHARQPVSTDAPVDHPVHSAAGFRPQETAGAGQGLGRRHSRLQRVDERYRTKGRAEARSVTPDMF